MFSQIIFPVDFTGSSERVVPFVRSMAEKYETTVHVVHVVAEVAVDMYVPGEAIVSFISELKASAEKMLEEYCTRHFGGFPKVFGHVLEGDPVEEILTFAREANKGLIIMATHGRKGLDRVVFRQRGRKT